MEYRRPTIKAIDSIDITADTLTISSSVGIFRIRAARLDFDSVKSLISLLNGSRTYRDLAEESQLAEQTVRELVSVLDRYRLIIEGDPSIEVMPSSQYIDLLEDMINPLYNTIAQTNPLVQALKKNPIQQALAYGYAIENYHFQRRQSLFGSIILSARSLPQKALDLLKKAYLTEDGHDRLVLRAFNDSDRVVDSLMLPSNEALTAYLANLAMGHPLSYISALSCIEGYHTYDGDLFARVITDQNSTFGAPFVEHDKINQSNDHGSITRQILETFDIIPNSDVKIALKNVRRLLGMIDAHWREVYLYYSSPGAAIPRKFPLEAPPPVPVAGVESTGRHFKQPALRSGVRIQQDKDSVSVAYAGRSFHMRSGNAIDIHSVLMMLDGTHSIETLAEKAKVSRETLDAALTQLDGCGILVEGRYAMPPRLPAIEFIQSLEEWTQVWYQSHYGYTNLLKVLESGTASQTLLTQYAWEYYHITANALSAIGPSLSLETDPERLDLLRQFYLEEIGHENMLSRVLVSLGASAEEIVDSIPLPSTSYVVELLRFLSAHDPLSFMGALFLFEGTEGQKDAIVDLLEKHYPQLPTVFVEMLRKHDSINEEAEHGNISRKLYATVGGISRVDARRVMGTLYNLISLVDGFYEGLLERAECTNVPIDRLG